MAEETCASTICEMECELIEALHSEMEKGLSHMNTHEAGEVADIIKDLAEAEFYIKKSCNMTAIEHLKHELSKASAAEKLAMKTEITAIIADIK